MRSRRNLAKTIADEYRYHGDLQPLRPCLSAAPNPRRCAAVTAILEDLLSEDPVVQPCRLQYLISSNKSEGHQCKTSILQLLPLLPTPTGRYEHGKDAAKITFFPITTPREQERTPRSNIAGDTLHHYRFSSKCLFYCSTALRGAS